MEAKEENVKTKREKKVIRRKRKTKAKIPANSVATTEQPQFNTDGIEALLIQIRDKLEFICQESKRQTGG